MFRFFSLVLMVKNSEVARNNLVLETGTVRYVYLVSMIGNYDDCTLENDPLAKVDISRDGEVVEFQDVGNGGKPLGKVPHLFE